MLTCFSYLAMFVQKKVKRVKERYKLSNCKLANCAYRMEIIDFIGLFVLYILC